nr:putative zinc finger, CCHC-type [Tanacetum cinerariifolium]
MGALATIQEGNKCSEETKAKADVFLHQHIDQMLEFEYSNCDDPSILWKDLETRFNNQREVLLPSARDEWNNLRFQDFKKDPVSGVEMQIIGQKLVARLHIYSVITKLVDLIGPHDHLNPIFVPKCDGSWRVDYCVIMLVFKAGGIPSRFGEVELSLPRLKNDPGKLVAALDSLRERPYQPPSGSGLLTLCLMIESFTLSVDARVDAQSFFGTGTSYDGMDHAGSGVTGLSSSSGFHQSYRKFTLGIWASPMSSSSDECTCASGAISSSICRSSGVEETDNLSLVSVIVQALYSTEADVFEELGAVKPCD